MLNQTKCESSEEGKENAKRKKERRKEPIMKKKHKKKHIISIKQNVMLCYMAEEGTMHTLRTVDWKVSELEKRCQNQWRAVEALKNLFVGSHTCFI